MPADVPGVTTDDQGAPLSGGAGSGDPSEGTPSRPGPAPARGSEAAGNGASGDDESAAQARRAGSPQPGSSTAAGSPQAASGAAGGSPQPGGGTAAAVGPDDPTTESRTQPGPSTAPIQPVPPGVIASPEPPPAPVLVPPSRVSRFLHRGRHVPRHDRASRRGLRVNQRLWSISPWSVFKVSALFYLCVGLIVVVAGTLLYNTGRSVGTIDQFESFVTRMGAYGECLPTAEVPEGTVFEEDDKCDEGEVLVGGFTLDDGTLFKAGAIVVTVLVVAGSIGNVLLTVLVNLLNELTGGLRHTVIREPVPRPADGGSTRPPNRGSRVPPGQRRSPSGSLRRQPQR